MDEDAKLYAVFLQQQQLIESLLSTQRALLQQHEGCMSLCAQMTRLSMAISTAAPAAPGRGKKRRDTDAGPEDSEATLATDDTLIDDSLADTVLDDEPSVVFRSCSGDGDDIGEFDSSKLALQV